jgi:hypothetical protein
MIVMRGQDVSEQNLQTGDLLFFATGGGSQVSHAGIYVGEGRFVHAPQTGGTVKLDTLSKAYWQNAYLSAKRVAGRATWPATLSQPKIPMWSGQALPTSVLWWSWERLLSRRNRHTLFPTSSATSKSPCLSMTTPTGRPMAFHPCRGTRSARPPAGL